MGIEENLRWEKSMKLLQAMRRVGFKNHGFFGETYTVKTVTREGYVKLEGCAGEYLPEVLVQQG